MKNTKIEWTTHTWNAWEGCTKVSPGCANCYAADRDNRWHKGIHWGPGAPRRRTSEDYWKQPVIWNKQAGIDNPFNAVTHRPRVFCASLADWLDDEVPTKWRADLLDIIRRTPNLDWQLLTKRPERWRASMEAIRDSEPGVVGQMAGWWLDGRHPVNVWIGTTVEDQLRADERIPHLLKIPARVRFLSCEPLLGPVKIPSAKDPCDGQAISYLEGIHWVICGGESGTKARPMHPDWARSLRDQCAAANVPFFFKQWGEHDQNEKRVGKAVAGSLLDGKEHKEFPK